MKIYRFSSYTERRESAAGNMNRNIPGGNRIKTAAGAEDMVELSTEAMERCLTGRTHASMEQNRAAARIVDFPCTRGSGNDSAVKSLKSGEYDFNDPAALARAAEEILMVFFPDRREHS